MTHASLKSVQLTALTALAGALMVSLSGCSGASKDAKDKDPVDYVNPYMGNISHLLVPTFPTVQLPNSMLRVYPQRADYTTERIAGLPIVVTHHRERSAFSLTPFQSEEIAPVAEYNYDNEVLTPYSYSAEIDDNSIAFDYAVSHQGAMYEIDFDPTKPATVVLNSADGNMTVTESSISGMQRLSDNTNIYVYMESEQKPKQFGVVESGRINPELTSAEGNNAACAWRFADGTDKVRLRYGISFISEDQAKKNLEREIKSYDIAALKDYGRGVWNEALGRISVDGGTDEDKTVFYTSFYRTFERPICMSEDGKYFSAFDGQVHEDEGQPFYTDDWIWDTYRAAHPLRALHAQEMEEDVLASFVRMAQQMGNMWMPTFPEVTGDSRRMNSNHAVASVADAMVKGLKVDTITAYEACRKGIEEKTLAPWSAKPAGWIDEFYKTNGYIPALKEGEKETDPNVHSFERRQPIAVTLGTSYDQFCLSQLALALGDTTAAEHYRQCALNYRNVFNPDTKFFHPKDKDNKFLEPFDYRYSGGIGARMAYGENNGYVYRWDVPHNIGDLIELIGGREEFVQALDEMYATPLGKSKFEFYSQLPDHTGNVGQFSMANEPSLHVPYLYNYAGAPWKTQKRIRQMIDTWFRNDLMGLPGDEDGGGMTAFVVFSQLGFYPVTPGIPAYNIGSPYFERAVVNLSNGKKFEIEAKNASKTNKYIQSATLNGQNWDKPWFLHDDIINGGKLVLVMGDKPNKTWGASETAVPPSM